MALVERERESCIKCTGQLYFALWSKFGSATVWHRVLRNLAVRSKLTHRHSYGKVKLSCLLLITYSIPPCQAIPSHLSFQYTKYPLHEHDAKAACIQNKDINRRSPPPRKTCESHVAECALFSGKILKNKCVASGFAI